MKQIMEDKAPIKLWRIVLALVNYLGGYVYFYPWVIQKISNGMSRETYIIVVFVLDIILPLAINIYLLFPLFKESLENFLKTDFLKGVKSVIYGVIFLFVGSVVIGLVGYYLFGLETSENQESVNLLFENYPLITFFLACIFAPIVEESIFRGIFYRVPRKKLGLALSLILTGLTFGFVHVMDAVLAGNLIELAYIFVYGFMGVILALEYESNQSIFFCMLTHALYNFMALRMIG